MMLKGKISVVTGASRGIGKCIAETFVKNGASVFACVRSMTQEIEIWAQALESSHGVFVKLILLDLADENSTKNLVKQVMAINPRVDILVNNAGVASGSLMQMTTSAELKRIFEINFFNQIVVTQGISRLMQRAKAGSIVNIASTAAYIADPGTIAYGASKAALVRASASMATELGTSNIRVNSIAPGITKTDMFDLMSPTARDKLINNSALKRAAEPQDIANVALFLASDLSSYVTGQTIRVDGGFY